MGREIRIAVLGDRMARFEPHAATDAALRHTAAALRTDLRGQWIATPDIRARMGVDLAAFDGFLITPGSPYRDLEGMLEGIRFARESGKPVLGNCAGFQHMALECARTVPGLGSARSEEYGPGEGVSVITPLACSVAGQRLPVNLHAGSLAHGAYGELRVEERYYCRFGLVAEFQDALDGAGFRVTGVDDDGEARVLELDDHPFYVATLYVPQALSRPDRPHPLILAFGRAVLEGSGAAAAPAQVG